MYQLTIENGLRAGECVRPTNAELTIGRDSGNQLQLVDNGVSGRHCKLRIRRHGITIRDCDSACGVYVNNQPIKGETRLASGSAIELGGVRLRFEFLHDMLTSKRRITTLFWIGVMVVMLTFLVEFTGAGLAVYMRFHPFTSVETDAVLKIFPTPVLDQPSGPSGPAKQEPAPVKPAS